MATSRQYKISGTKDFNDLVAEQVMFGTSDDASRILYEMFPDEDVSLIMQDDNSYVISVGEVSITITVD